MEWGKKSLTEDLILLKGCKAKLSPGWNLDHRRGGGHALDAGCSGSATNGIEDVKGVRQWTLHDILHRRDLYGG